MWIIHVSGGNTQSSQPRCYSPCLPLVKFIKKRMDCTFTALVSGCVKATFGSRTAFYGYICDILLILRNVLGANIQESALLDEYIEGCLDVVVLNK